MIPQWSQPYVNRYFSLRIRYRRHTYLYDTQILMANSFNLSLGLSKAIAYTLDIECNWFSCTCLVQVTVNKPNQAHLGLCESDVTSKLFCGNHPSKWAHPTIHLSPPSYIAISTQPCGHIRNILLTSVLIIRPERYISHTHRPNKLEYRECFSSPSYIVSMCINNVCQNIYSMNIEYNINWSL